MDARNTWFVAGFLAGGAVAAAAALLYAPARGARTRAAIRAHFDTAAQEAREAGRRAEAEILTRYQAVRSAALTTEPGRPSLAPAAA